MLFENNPITKATHEYHREKIAQEFSDIEFSPDSDYLSLHNYLEKIPWKFFSREAYSKYLLFLNEVKTNDPIWLADILKEAEGQLSLSNKILVEINENLIHDIPCPRDHELRDFVDREIHYRLLKLYETPFYQFILIAAKYSRKKRGVSLDKLDLFNAVEEIKKGDLGFVTSLYSNTIRNGISHGKIVFTDSETSYIDKKAGEKKIATREIVDTFDKTLDITNGFCLAFKVFYLSNATFFNAHKIPPLRSFLLEELQAKANGPAWTISNCIESIAIGERQQLNISIKNGFWDFSKVQFNSYITAYWAERLTKTFDRIFIHLDSKHSLNGWVAFDGKKLREIRERNETELATYKGVVEENILFFVPRKLPKLIYKLGSLYSAFKMSIPLTREKYRDQHKPVQFVVRDTKIHRKSSGFTVISDPSIIIKTKDGLVTEELIRTHRRKIIRTAIRYSRKKCGRFSLTRYLPVRYIRVFIYDSDKRVRNLSGLIPQLVATIEVNTSRKIRTIDIFGSTVERIGKYRIAWYNHWKGRATATLSTPP